jgi:hypothetical protein
MWLRFVSHATTDAMISRRPLASELAVYQMHDCLQRDECDYLCPVSRRSIAKLYDSFDLFTYLRIFSPPAPPRVCWVPDSANVFWYTLLPVSRPAGNQAIAFIDDVKGFCHHVQKLSGKKAAGTARSKET